MNLLFKIGINLMDDALESKNVGKCINCLLSFRVYRLFIYKKGNLGKYKENLYSKNLRINFSDYH